jgi:hypothetical protein
MLQNSESVFEMANLFLASKKTKFLFRHFEYTNYNHLDFGNVEVSRRFGGTFCSYLQDKKRVSTRQYGFSPKTKTIFLDSTHLNYSELFQKNIDSKALLDPQMKVTQNLTNLTVKHS